MPDPTSASKTGSVRRGLRDFGTRWFYAYVAVMAVGVLVSASNYWAAQSTGAAVLAAEGTFADLVRVRTALEKTRSSAREVMKPINRLFLDGSLELDVEELAEHRGTLLSAAGRAESELAGLGGDGRLDLGTTMLVANADELDAAVTALLAGGTEATTFSSMRLALANHWFQQLVHELGRIDSRLSDETHQLQVQLAESVARTERHKGLILAATVLLLAGAAIYGFFLNREFGLELQARERLLGDLQRSRGELEAQALELRKMSWVAERTKNAIVVTDSAGCIEWVNEGFTGLTGYALEEARGKRPGKLLQGPHTDRETVARIRARLEHREPVDEEILNYAKDGRVYWARLEIQPVRSDSGEVTHFVAVTSDISAQKSIQQQLERARDHALAAASARAQFLANTSHEIRTPMNGVLGMTELLLRTPLDDKQRHFAQTILRSGRHLLAIINDVLDFAKMEAGRFELDPVATCLPDLLEEIASGVEVEARGRGLDFLLLQEPPGIPRVRVDAGRLRQILLNLTSNALKFTTSGRITLRLRWQHARDRAESVDLRIAVIDTGNGIPAEMQRHIFEPFVQASRKVAVEVGGTGLGLPIARQLARLMQGELSLASEVGRGSTFELRLRLAIADEAELDATAEIPLAPLGRRVLVAEDYPVNQEVIRGALEALGCSAKVVDDGLAVIEAYQREPDEYDAILMDCRMPRVDGFEATERIREWESVTGRPPVPIVAVTAGALASERRRCEEVGMTAFLAKPIELAELRATLLSIGAPRAAGASVASPGHDRCLARG